MKGIDKLAGDRYQKVTPLPLRPNIKPFLDDQQRIGEIPQMLRISRQERRNKIPYIRLTIIATVLFLASMAAVIQAGNMVVEFLFRKWIVGA
jgi:hypothetical protein